MGHHAMAGREGNLFIKLSKIYLCSCFFLVFQSVNFVFCFQAVKHAQVDRTINLDPEKFTSMVNHCVWPNTYVHIYIYYIWVNYNDLTATSLESCLVRGIIPGVNSG